MPEEDHIDVTAELAARAHPLQKEEPSSFQKGFNI